MANPVKGEAQLGEYTLAFNFGAFCELEDKTDLKMPQLLQSLMDGLGFKELRDFVWAGLLTHHCGISDEAILAVLDEHGFEASASAVGKAVTAFFGAQKEKGKNPPKAG
jgi:hypothetical protein